MKPQYLVVIHLEILLNKSLSLTDTPYINLCYTCVRSHFIILDLDSINRINKVPRSLGNLLIVNHAHSTDILR